MNELCSFVVVVVVVVCSTTQALLSPQDFRFFLNLARQAAKRDLLSADFEGILRYFRIGLPRRYHKSEDYGKQLIHLAGTFKLRKLEKYERQYWAVAGTRFSPLNLFSRLSDVSSLVFNRDENVEHR